LLVDDEARETIMKVGMSIMVIAALLTGGAVAAAEIKVLSTQATEQSYRELVPQFEAATGHKVTTLFTGTLDADKRIAAGEQYDLLIMADTSIDHHTKGGKVMQGSRVDLARSGVGVGVKAGAPKPDISSLDALKRTLTNAKSIGYSSGPSGVYIVQMFERLGMMDQLKPKLKQTPSGVFVGSIIANGDVEIGFQQVSELSQFEGVDYVGPLPAPVQNYTTFSAGVLNNAKEADAARALIRYITSSQAGAVYRKRGMEPAVN
jgi:molybdate transport system substrate-binding protein